MYSLHYLDVYADTIAEQPDDVKESFRNLARRISNEVEQQELMCKTLGAIETVLCMGSSMQLENSTVNGKQEQNSLIGSGIVITDNRRTDNLLLT